MAKKHIQLIIGSSRQHRLGDQIAAWAATEAGKQSDIELEIIDLKEVNLPFFDAAVPPSRQPDASPAGKAWGARIAQADGFLFVTPEYNRSIPAPLKNALDFLVQEWRDKPAGIVSYGWIDGGQGATRHLHDVLSWLKLATISTNVALHLNASIMGEDGCIKDPKEAFKQHEPALRTILNHLVTYSAPVPAAA